MRAAIRGDFERLEERRGDQVLLRPREEPEIGTRLTEPAATEQGGASLQQTDAGVEVREPPKRSWIDRLLRL